MRLEQKINYSLNQFPALKRTVKKGYQMLMYTLSPKLRSEGSIVRLSPADETSEYFFGYYDKCPWDRTDRYILCMRTKNTWKQPSPKEKADLLVIDTKADTDDRAKIRFIGSTHAWNVQQGCMLQWLGPDFSSKVIFNDYRDGKYVSVIYTLSDQTERIIDAPVYAVCEDGKTALSLDFSRLYELSPGYGYYNIPEKTRGMRLPDSYAVRRIDLERGNISDLFSYRDLASFQPRPEMENPKAIHKVNHLMINPSGKRFMLLYRWLIHGRKYTRLLTCDMSGENLYVLSDDDMVSHCFWKTDDEILAFANKVREGTGYYLMRDCSEEYVHCWKMLDGDGHPSYCADRSRIVTDSYPDKARIQRLWIMEDEKAEPKEIAKVFSPFRYDNDTRCDLHPRWNHSGDAVCFDSVFEGRRGLYCVKTPRTREGI